MMAARKIRVGVSGHDLKFWHPIQRKLEATRLFEFREDVWQNHDVHDQAESRALLAWADVLVAEWALGNAVYYSRHKLPHQKLLVRLHLQERNTPYLKDIDYGNVDRLTFVGPHIMRECISRFSIPQEICSVLGNYVEADRFALDKHAGAEFTLGMIGTAPSRKRLDLALDTLELLVANDERYMLRVKGDSPAAYPWLWERSSERRYYEEVYARINSGSLRHKVVFDPRADDVHHWLRMVGTVLSPSDFESFHLAVAEGVASNALPVVWDWEGASEIYPGLSTVQTPEDAARQIEAHVRGDLIHGYVEQLRAGVDSRYGSAVIDAWEALLRPHEPTRHSGLRSGLGHRAGEQTVSAPNVPGEERAKALNELKVALVCDEFTYNSFRDEFVPLVLEPHNWREVLERDKPDLFFCESAWSGVDSETRPWKGRVYTSVNFKNENRGALLDILKYCKDLGIPTVFWNKEDPSHYDDAVHNFVDTAKLFDVVFTTDVACVERYKADHGLKQVYCLPFATQPRIFNPVESAVRSDAVVFAGSWYANHADRCDAMGRIFDAVLESGRGLEIYDRFHGGNDPSHIFPAKYRPYLRPAIPHSEIAGVYKSSRFGLNMNTETKSPTMFARRVFELMSCNTLCLSNYSLGMERMFGDSVVFMDRDPDALSALSDEAIGEKREKALHEVLRRHTYKERFKTIVRSAGIPFVDRSAEITVVCVVDSHESARAAVDYFNRQAAYLPCSRLLLVLDRSVPDIEVQGYYEAYNCLGATTLAMSYFDRYAEQPGSAIGTEYFALVDFTREVAPDLIANAFLHTAYVDDAVIVIGHEEKYRYRSEAKVENVIAGSRYFPLLLRSRGELLKSRFYSV
jgi:spore maturation protein CgeB/glycosyltransferase involved in cell wall biosynthesis